MAALGLAVLTQNETRLAMAALLWVVLEKKVSRAEPGYLVPATEALPHDSIRLVSS